MKKVEKKKGVKVLRRAGKNAGYWDVNSCDITRGLP